MTNWYVTREVHEKTNRYEAADYRAALKYLHHFDKLAGGDSDARLWAEESGRIIDCTEEARRDLARDADLRRQHNVELRPAAFKKAFQTFSAFLLLWGLMLGAVLFFASDIRLEKVFLGLVLFICGCLVMAILDVRKFYHDKRYEGLLDD